MTNWLDVAADVVLGATCPGCGCPGWGLCTRCRAALARDAGFEVTRLLDDFPPAAAAGVYEGVLRRLIAAHKERGARQATVALGGLLAGVVAQLGVGSVTLVPVPSTPAAVRRRGYDSVHLIASDAARRLRRRGEQVIVVRALRHARHIHDQAGLDTSARWANLAGAMVARPVAGPVLVVDDVCTTGATILEACRALRAAGVERCGAATVSATLLRHG